MNSEFIENIEKIVHEIEFHTYKTLVTAYREKENIYKIKVRNIFYYENVIDCILPKIRKNLNEFEKTSSKTNIYKIAQKYWVAYKWDLYMASKFEEIMNLCKNVEDAEEDSDSENLVNKKIRELIIETCNYDPEIFYDEVDDTWNVAVNENLYYHNEKYLMLVTKIKQEILWPKNIYNYLFILET